MVEFLLPLPMGNKIHREKNPLTHCGSRKDVSIKHVAPRLTLSKCSTNMGPISFSREMSLLEHLVGAAAQKVSYGPRGRGQVHSVSTALGWIVFLKIHILMS